MSRQSVFPRRRFLQTSAAALGIATPPRWANAQAAPGLITSDLSQPVAAHALAFGDPANGKVLVWSRSDRPARMILEWSLDAQFREAQRIVRPYASSGAATPPARAGASTPRSAG